MEILAAQCITIAIFFTSMFISCLLPLKIVPTGPNYELGISLANCLSAGVFLATFFIGLLPEVRQQFQFLLHHYQIVTRFPVTDFIVCCGFFLALFTEQAIIACKDNHKHIVSDELQLSTSNAHTHSHSHDVSAAISGTGVRLGLLLSSLGVHSIFEGMTLGLQTRTRELFNLFIGVLIHECLIAFAIGVNMASAKLKFITAMKLALLISSTIPVGQIIGFVIGANQGVYNGGVGVILQAVAAGTFIQVTFMEIIPEGLAGKRLKMVKLVCFGVGFAVIAFVCAMTEVRDAKREKAMEDYNVLLKLKYEAIH